MALSPEEVEARAAKKREYANRYRLEHPGQAKITRKARREWQRANGLTCTGQVPTGQRPTGQVKANTLRKELHD